MLSYTAGLAVTSTPELQEYPYKCDPQPLLTHQRCSSSLQSFKPRLDLSAKDTDTLRLVLVGLRVVYVDKHWCGSQ